MSVSQSSRTAHSRMNKKRSRSQAGSTRNMSGGTSVRGATKDIRWAFAFLVLLLVTAADASAHQINRRLIRESGSGKARNNSNIFDKTSKGGGKGTNMHNANVFDRKSAKTQAPSISPGPTGAPFLSVGKSKASKQVKASKSKGKKQGKAKAKKQKKVKKAKTQAPSGIAPTSVPTNQVTPMPVLSTRAPVETPQPSPRTTTASPSLRTTPSPTTTTAAPSPTTTTAAPSPSTTTDPPTGGLVVPATPFSGGYINAGANPTISEFEDAELRTCDFLRDFFVDFYSFSFETTLALFTCAAVTFGSGPAQISYDVSLTFTEDSFLIPSQEDVDLLLSTAFQPPTVNALLTELSLSAGAFATTTAVDYSTTVSTQSFTTVQSIRRESSGTTFVAGAFVIFISGIFIVKRRGHSMDQTQSETFSWGREPESLLDPEDYEPESHAILGRLVNQPMPGHGYMGFDEAIEIDFVPSDEHETLGASRNALFKRPFLLTPFGGERFGGERRGSFTPYVGE
jgi:hypothetical protein